MWPFFVLEKKRKAEFFPLKVPNVNAIFEI